MNTLLISKSSNDVFKEYFLFFAHFMLLFNKSFALHICTIWSFIFVIASSLSFITIKIFNICFYLHNSFKPECFLINNCRESN